MKQTLSLVLLLAACTARSSYVYPPEVSQRYLITQGGTDRPYQSVGYVQITRKGGDIFGYLPIVDADLEVMFGELLIEELQRHGADGIINVHFNERQWTTAERLPFLLIPLLWFWPVPTLVELNGEMIRWVPGPPATVPPPVPASPVAPPGSPPPPS